MKSNLWTCSSLFFLVLGLVVLNTGDEGLCNKSEKTETEKSRHGRTLHKHKYKNPDKDSDSDYDGDNNSNVLESKFLTQNPLIISGSDGVENWSEVLMCQPGAVATGFKFSFVGMPNVHMENPFGIQGVALQCASLDLRNNFRENNVIYFGLGVNPRVPWKYTSSSQYIIGFEFLKWTDSNRMALAGKWRFLFINEKPRRVPFPADAAVEDRVREEVKCPNGMAVCGFQVLTNFEVGMITKIRLRCCSFCYPEEVYMVIYDFTNLSPTDVTHTVTKRIGLQVSNSELEEETLKKGANVNPEKSGHIRRNQMNQTPLQQATSALFDLFTDRIYSRFGLPILNRVIPAQNSTSLPATTAPNPNPSVPVSVGLRLNSTRVEFEFPSSPFKTQQIAPPPPEVVVPGEDLLLDYQYAYDDEEDKELMEYLRRGNFDDAVPELFNNTGREVRITPSPVKTTGKKSQYFPVMQTQTAFPVYKEKRRNKKQGNKRHRVRRQAGPPSNGSPSKPSNPGNSVPPSAPPSQPGNDLVPIGPAGPGTVNRPGSGSGAGSGGGDSDGGGGGGGGRGGSRTGVTEIQAAFAAKYGKSKDHTSHWSTTDWQLSTTHHEEMENILCKALHRCILKQLVGLCTGNPGFKFSTPTFKFIQIPLTLDPFGLGLGDRFRNKISNLTSTPSFDMTIKRPNEIWIVAQNLTFAPRSRIWESPKSCPSGSFVTSQQIKSRPGRSITGLNLECSRLNSSEKWESVGILSTGTGLPKKWYKAHSQAVGVTMVQYWTNGMNVKQNFELRFSSKNSTDLPVPPMAQNVQRTQIMCPEKYGVCGMQAMYDLVNMDEMTDLGLQCCYSCTPEQRMVMLDSFMNLGYTDTIQTITKVTGGHLIRAEANAGTNHTANIDNMNGVTPAGLQAGFAAKFDSSNFDGFNWQQTSNSLWTTHEEKTLTIVCKARHMCNYRQLVGVCGDIEVPTPYTIKESFWLDDPTRAAELARLQSQNQSASLIPLPSQVINSMTFRNNRRNKGTWILAQNISFSNRSESDIWEPPLLCPLGSVVTTQQFKKDDRFYLSGLRLVCCAVKENGVFDYVKELSSGLGKARKLYISNTPAVGFAHAEYLYNGSNWKGLWEVKFKGQTNFHPTPVNATNVTRAEVECPEESQAICGFMAMYDNRSLGHLTDLAFKCCFHCVPSEKMIVLDSYTNHGFTDTMQNVQLVIGAGISSQRNIMRKNSSSIHFEMELNGRTDDNEDNIKEMGLLLQQLFTNRFGSLTTPKSRNVTGRTIDFNWSQTTLSFWTEERKLKNMSVLCKARHSCQFNQLVGFCGDWEIYTPFTFKDSQKLDKNKEAKNSILKKKGSYKNDKNEKTNRNSHSNSLHQKPLQNWHKSTNNSPENQNLDSRVPAPPPPPTCQKKNGDGAGEIWIVAQNLSTVQRRSGVWEPLQNCPVHSFVTAAQVQTVPAFPHESSSVSASVSTSFLTGLNLVCSSFKSNGSLSPAKILYGESPRKFPKSMEKNWNSHWKNSTSPATGFSFITYELSREIFKGYWRLCFGFHGDCDKIPDSMTRKAVNVEDNKVNCPVNHALCGFQQMREGLNNGIVTDIAFKCCLFCHEAKMDMSVDILKSSNLMEKLMLMSMPVSMSPSPVATISPLSISSNYNQSNTKTLPSKETEKLMKHPEKENDGQLNTNDTKKMEPRVEMEKDENGEIWILARNISSFPQTQSLISSGQTWERPNLLPTGTFVTGAKFIDDSKFSLTSIQLVCSKIRVKRNLNNNETEFKLNIGRGESFEKMEQKQDLNNHKDSPTDFLSPAIGFTFIEFNSMILGMENLRGVWQFRFQGVDKYHKITMMANIQNVRRHQILCPLDHVICGIQIMYDDNSRENAVITNIRFKCCFWCVPREKLVVLNSMTNLDSSESQEQKVEWLVGVTNQKQRSLQLTNSPYFPSLFLSPPSSFSSLTSDFSYNNLNLPSNLASIFGTLGASSVYFGFHWDQTSPYLWTTALEKKETNYTCKPHHFCIFKQLMGECGDFHVQTPVTLKLHMRVDD